MDANHDTGLACPKCGYNLTAITSNRCPECGETFVVTNAEGYLARHPRSAMSKLCTAVWVVGTVLIVGSWIGAVSTEVGWIGFIAAVSAWLVSLVVRR